MSIQRTRAEAIRCEPNCKYCGYKNQTYMIEDRDPFKRWWYTACGCTLGGLIELVCTPGVFRSLHFDLENINE